MGVAVPQIHHPNTHLHWDGRNALTGVYIFISGPGQQITASGKPWEFVPIGMSIIRTSGNLEKAFSHLLYPRQQPVKPSYQLANFS